MKYLPSHRRSTPLVTAVAALLVALATMAYSPRAHAIDDPALNYHTITTENFYVHYYDGLDELARRTAIYAEESHEVLVPLMDWKPASRTHVLVTDKLDTANGFARVFGRNFIAIYGMPPSADHVLGYFDDWLRILVYHEYVHILHLDTNLSLYRWLNRVIGKQFHPNAVLPRWYVEGIAVYLESARTGRGRVDSPLFRMWLRTAALDDELFDLGRATGLPFDWPSGTGPYLYGAFFIDYIVRQHGENFIRDFNHEYGRRLIPFALNHVTRQVVGDDLEELWEGFVAEAKADALAHRVAVEAAGRTELELLTDGGGRSRYPTVRPGHNGEITFYRADLTSHPVYATIAASGQRISTLHDGHGAAGPAAWSPDGETLYFSRSDITGNVYNYQDLYAYTPSTGDYKRLTEADRAREPAVSPDGAELVYVRNRHGSMELVRRFLDDSADGEDAVREEIILGRNDFAPRDDGHWQQISRPVFTPDGTGVVFSWWRLDRRQRDLYLVDLETKETTQLTDSPAHDIDPHFGPEGYLYFSSNVDDVFNIHAMDMNTHQIWQVTNVLRGVFSPAVSSDRRWIYVYTYTHRGFEIARLQHPQRFYHADQRPTERTRPWLEYPEPQPHGIDDPRPYRPWPWLLPQTFMPEFGALTGGSGIGATLFGYDPVEHHEYTLSGGLTTGPNFTDYGANLGLAYSYRGSALNLSTLLRFQDYPRTQSRIAMSRYVPYIERQYLGRLNLSYPIRRRGQSFSLSTRFDVEYLDERQRQFDIEHEPGDIRPTDPPLGFFNQLTFGLSYSSQFRYPLSISTERGVSASTTVGIHHPSLGHPDSALTLSYGLDLYQPNPFLKRHVFALRVRGALNRSATGLQRRYAIGGYSPQDVLTSLIFQEPRRGFPLRGYAPGEFRGTQYQVWKLEYRFPIWEFDRGFGTLPIFVRNVKGSLFADHGTAFDGFLLDADFHTGIGGEVQLDTILGYYDRNSLRLGYARGLGEAGLSEFYLLYGASF